jgi:lipopolysaccharide transport system ATP-binding protein
MYLRANGLSLYFPARGIHAPDGRNRARVGGRLVEYRGKPHVRALDGVDFSLERGDRLGIVGHNGSGKSTLLRALAGLYTPQRGSVEAGGPVSGIFNMSVGFRQEASGYRNILLKGLMAGKSKREVEAAVPAIAEFTELGRYLEMPLHTYSQGMALRLAFAITTTFSHDILVMDEWIGAGDAQFQERVVARMNSFLETAHICVLASHNNALLRRITDRCLWLEDGAVRDIGDTARILDEYEAETQTLRKAAEAEVKAARIPIPHGRVVLDARPGSGEAARAVRLTWNLGDFNVGRVKLLVRDQATGQERLVAMAPAIGQHEISGWVQPGMEFLVRDELDDLLLGTLVIEPRHLS